MNIVMVRDALLWCAITATEYARFFFLNPYLRKKTLAFPSTRIYYSRRSYYHAANTDNKNWLPTNCQFFLRR
jgi:hypothetical protein